MTRKIVIVGGGISGLSTAFLLQKHSEQYSLGWQITLLEQNSYLGGKIRSIQDNGYLCEWGPNGFLNNRPQTLQLCADLGLSKQLLSSNDDARRRFVYDGDKLYQLPHSLIGFAKSDLISLRGKLRIAAEAFIAKKSSATDESISDFIKRRLGLETLDKLISPMVSGIFAGNPDELSLKACFPRIANLEQQYGGLIKALLKIAYAKKFAAPEKNSASFAGPGGILTSFNNGLGELTDALYKSLTKTDVISDCKVSKINKLSSGNYQITTQQQAFNADNVICATPSYITAQLLSELDESLANDLRQINYAPLVVVCLGYDKYKIDHDLNGFGYLLTHNTQLQVLGTLWESSIFASRAPDAKVLLRTMLGGATAPQLIDLADVEILELVTKSLSQILAINIPPEFIRIFRHKYAIPNYQLGHVDRVAQIEQKVNMHHGLFITGNAYHGVGVNDCIAASYKLRDQMIAK